MSRSHHDRPRHSPSVRADIDFEKVRILRAERLAALTEISEGAERLTYVDEYNLEPDFYDDPYCDCPPCRKFWGREGDSVSDTKEENDG